MALMRPLLLALSQHSGCRNAAQNWSLGQRLSSRFVAGTEPTTALNVVEELNSQGFAVSLDYLGENVLNTNEACRTGETYHRLLDAIDRRGLNCHVSVKLTQMGLDLDVGLARQIVGALVRHAAQIGSFVRVDMEGSRYTEATLELVRNLHQEHSCKGHVGAVIQSYLRRSATDLADMLQHGIRIRLCKGAYAEPSDIAFPRKLDVDANYLSLAQMLLGSESFHAFATHDYRIITEIQRIARNQNISADRFEFQMLYGVRRDLQRAIVNEGYRMRVYVPFGTAWYPYFMRRLAERPANVVFLAKNLFRT